MIDGVDWLASYPKSGNTWVRAFLSAYLLGGQMDINRLDVIGNSDVHGGYWHPLIPKDPGSLSAQELMLYRPAALYNMLHSWKHVGKDRNPVVKTHTALTVLSGIETIPALLTKRAIVIVRDPRDVVVSSSGWFQQSYDDGIARMREDSVVIGGHIRMPMMGWSTWVRNWQQCTRPWLMFRYEDILKDPAGEFRQMLEFLEWPVDEDLIQQCVDATSFDRMKAQEKEKGMRENLSDGEFFRRGRWGTYQGNLTDRQIRQIERDHGELMQELGYPLGEPDAMVN